MYLTVSPKYNPFTYDELIKPLQDQQGIYEAMYKLSKDDVDLAEKARDNAIKEEERQQAYQDRINKAAAAFGSLAEMVGDDYDWNSLNLSWGDQTGKDAWNAQYNDALSALQNNPYDPETLRKIGSLYSTYQSKIAPALVQQSYERDKRDKEEAEQRQRDFQANQAALSREHSSAEAQKSREATAKQHASSAALSWYLSGKKKVGDAIYKYCLTGDSTGFDNEEVKKELQEAAAAQAKAAKKGSSEDDDETSEDGKWELGSIASKDDDIETLVRLNTLLANSGDIYYIYRDTDSGVKVKNSKNEWEEKDGGYHLVRAPRDKDPVDTRPGALYTSFSAFATSGTMGGGDNLLSKSDFSDSRNNKKKKMKMSSIKVLTPEQYRGWFTSNNSNIFYQKVTDTDGKKRVIDPLHNKTYGKDFIMLEVKGTNRENPEYLVLENLSEDVTKYIKDWDSYKE